MKIRNYFWLGILAIAWTSCNKYTQATYTNLQKFSSETLKKVQYYSDGQQTVYYGDTTRKDTVIDGKLRIIDEVAVKAYIIDDKEKCAIVDFESLDDNGMLGPETKLLVTCSKDPKRYLRFGKLESAEGQKAGKPYRVMALGYKNDQKGEFSDMVWPKEAQAVTLYGGDTAFITNLSQGLLLDLKKLTGDEVDVEKEKGFDVTKQNPGTVATTSTSTTSTDPVEEKKRGFWPFRWAFKKGKYK